MHRTVASSGTASRGGAFGGQRRLWSGVTAGFDQRGRTVGAGGWASCAGSGSTTATGSPISIAVSGLGVRPPRSPHDVLLVVKERVTHPAHVVSFELHVERVHHELPLSRLHVRHHSE